MGHYTAHKIVSKILADKKSKNGIKLNKKMYDAMQKSRRLDEWLTDSEEKEDER